jgi:hypothetical protein
MSVLRSATSTICLGDFVAVETADSWQVRRVAALLERGFTVEPAAAARDLYLWDERGRTWSDETVDLRAPRKRRHT